jgi:hypothetical protein
MRKLPIVRTALCSVALIGSARAARAANADGAIVISVSTTLASYSKLDYTLELPRPLHETPGAISGVMFGPSANPVTFEFGYHLSAAFNLGLLLEVGSTTLRTESQRFNIDDSEMLARFLVGPRAEFVFGSGSLRPYVVGVVGFTTAPRQDTSPQEDVSRTVRFNGIEGLLGVGLHWFLTDSFSIDPALRAGFGGGRGTIDQKVVTQDAAGMEMSTVYRDVHARGTLLSGSALLGLSGWVP